MADTIKTPSAPLRHTWSTRTGALLWLLCCQFFVCEQVARRFVLGPYSMARNMISDLGALHSFGESVMQPATSFSPLHALMNASFVLQGFLIAGGALLARRLFPSRGIATAAFVCLVLSGLGVLVVGLAPEDTHADLHVFAAVTHFVCGGLGMLLSGISLLRMQGRELPATLSIGAGIVALAATVLLGFSHSAHLSSVGFAPGVLERIAAYPLPAWLSVTGLALVSGHRPATSTT